MKDKSSQKETIKTPTINIKFIAMSKSKVLIERNLSFSEKYTYIDITRGSLEDGNVTSCDNCGKIISNIAHIVRNSDYRHFYIGTDCAETLAQAKTLYKSASGSDFWMDMYALGIVNRFVTQFNKTPDLLQVNAMFAYIIVTGEVKGKIVSKEVRCSIFDLKKFNPEIYKAVQLCPMD